eukprot:413701-Pyramimonas_sp.AAC.2
MGVGSAGRGLPGSGLVLANANVTTAEAACAGGQSQVSHLRLHRHVSQGLKGWSNQPKSSELTFIEHRVHSSPRGQYPSRRKADEIRCMTKTYESRTYCISCVWAAFRGCSWMAGIGIESKQDAVPANVTRG